MRHLNLYRAIRVVVNEGSIRKASEKLAISPSALNRQILALEEDLGVPFFERLPGGVRLSTAGEIYYRQFIGHIAEIEGANETVADLSGLRIGHVRIAVSRVLENGMLPRAVRAFRAEHPRVGFSLLPVSSDRFSEMLSSGRVDLALIAQPQYHEGVETLMVEDFPVLAVMSAALIDGVTALTPEMLSELDLVLPPGPAGMRAHHALGLKRLRLDLNPAVESAQLLPPWGNEGAQRASAQFCLSPAVTDEWLAMHKARMVPVARIGPARIALCKREGRILPVAADKFAQLLARSLQTAARQPSDSR